MEIPKVVARHWQLLLALGLLLIGVGWRLVPHVPNFAPVGAIALLGGMALGWRTAIWLPIGIMALSDLALGFYAGIEWTWLGFGLVTGLGYALRRLRFGWRLPLGAFGASIIFFIVSNFGVWVASGMYAHSLAGLMECYVMALPFLRATFVSDLVFATVLIGGYELVRNMPAVLAKRVPQNS